MRDTLVTEDTDTPLICRQIFFFVSPVDSPHPQSPPTISHLDRVMVGVCSILAHTLTVDREAHWNIGTPVFFAINLLVLPLPKRTDRRWVGSVLISWIFPPLTLIFLIRVNGPFITSMALYDVVTSGWTSCFWPTFQTSVFCVLREREREGGAHNWSRSRTDGVWSPACMNYLMPLI